MEMAINNSYILALQIQELQTKLKALFSLD